MIKQQQWKAKRGFACPQKKTCTRNNVQKFTGKFGGAAAWMPCTPPLYMLAGLLLARSKAQDCRGSANAALVRARRRRPFVSPEQVQ